MASAGPWTRTHVHGTLVAAGILEEIPDAMAKPGDKVFFMGVEEPDKVTHVAEVKSGGGLIGTHKIYRYEAGVAPKVIVDPASLTNPAYCGGQQVPGQGTLEVTIDVPNRLLSFRPTTYFASRETECPVGVTMVACKIAAIQGIETDLAGAVQEVFEIAFDSTSVKDPGSYAVGDAAGWNKHDGSVPVVINFLSKDFKDVDGLEPFFWSRSGTVNLTWNPGIGGRMAGTFQASVSVTFWATGKAANGDSIIEELIGTIRGSFDLPVQ